MQNPIFVAGKFLESLTGKLQTRMLIPLPSSTNLPIASPQVAGSGASVPHVFWDVLGIRKWEEFSRNLKLKQQTNSFFFRDFVHEVIII